ncbi:MAG: hypothetical protein ACLTN0_03215 [Coprococcus phoceensis]
MKMITYRDMQNPVALLRSEDYNEVNGNYPAGSNSEGAEQLQ